MAVKIIIINGSHRKNGTTALILEEICQQLKRYRNVDVQMELFWGLLPMQVMYPVR